MMNQVLVNTKPPYQILIGSGLLQTAGERLLALGCKRVAIVTDDAVAPLYLSSLCASLEAAGIGHCEHIFPNGEAQKCFPSLNGIYNFLSDHSVTRADLIVAFGDGVVGDITGFAAATYLRGVRFVQLPTTFLAQIDSSVGGKTAINSERGKNLIGSFWQPSLVLCDLDTLSTLPPEVFADGTAEAIKYGLLADPALFSLLKEQKLTQHLQQVVTRCVEIKRDYVQQDEHDTGMRMQLNLGHTVGHAIEKVSNFSVTHGHAVAAGTAVIARACAQHGICTEQTRDRVLQVLRQYHLLPSCALDAHAVAACFQFDKKREGASINAVLLRDIGSPFLQKMSLSQWNDFIRDALAQTLAEMEAST